MCGICGVLNKTRHVERGLLTAMTKSLSHRGPDFSDIYLDGRVGLGHTRLSIIDLTQEGNQPMFDASGNLAIVFNGEIYNFQELRKELISDGVRFSSQTDTEVILYLYQKFGVDCLKHLRGMFAFALWDVRAKKFFIARDRMGKKPLVYAETPDGFLFSSEINTLLKHPAVSKEIDIEALDLFLSQQYIPAPWTIFKNIRKLPPAHFALASEDGLTLHKYWTLDYREKIDISQDEALKAVQSKLAEAVRMRMVSDVPLGALLSGGVDSSLITAMMAQVSSERVKTFSIGFEEEAFNELPHARKVAEHLGTEHHEFIVKPNLLELLPKIVRQYGEPYGDKAALPSFAVSEIARQQVSVVLNGDGGDELAAGYWRYHRSWSQRLADWTFEKVAPPTPSLLRSEHLMQADSFFGKVRRKWLRSYQNPELSEVINSTFWHEPYKGHLFKPNVRSDKGVTNRWRGELLARSEQHSGNRKERMLWLLNHAYLPDDLLVKMDIASMAYGLEARSPLLDHELIELLAKIPYCLKTPRGESKFLLKTLAAKLVPPDVVYRTKMGFDVPVEQWLAGPLSEYLQSVLTDRVSGLESYFNMNTVQKIMDEHISGKRKHGFRLWTLLVFGIWHAQAIHSENL